MNRLISLAASYLVITEIIMRMPFFNQYNMDWNLRISILYLLFVYWFYPKYNFLIFISLIFLLFGKFGETAGILIYTSLLIVLIKLLLNRREAIDQANK